ncbi:MAG: DegV family protein [Candidatus Heimdallarchaeota archaeon]
MSPVKIVADSACDLSAEIINEFNIEVVPANIIFNDVIYSQFDLSRAEFYKRLAAGDVPTTGVPAPKQFKIAYERALQESKDVVVLTISKKLSAMYSTARMVANLFNEQLTLIDTEAATIESGLIVYLAAKKAKEGASKAQLVKFISEVLIPHSQLLGVVDTLKFLRKGGRIGTISWLMGSLLSIKPILRISNGVLHSPGKVRGKEHMHELLRKIAQKASENRLCETIIVGHSNVPHLGEELVDFIKDLPDPPEKVLLVDIGPTIASHLGPGAIGISWIGKYDSAWL